MKIIFCGGLKIVVELNASAYHCGIFIKLAVDFELLAIALKINQNNKMCI